MRNLKAQDQKRYNAISKWYTTAGSGDAERPNMSWDSHQPIASDESTDRSLFVVKSLSGLSWEPLPEG